MLLHNQAELITLLYAILGVLLFFAVIATVIAALKSFQVRQFQDLLFKAERKIDNLERRMFNVLNAVPVALVETDTTGKFTFANKAAHQLLGRRDSELIGLRFHAATWGIAYPDGRQVPADLMPISRTLRGQTVKGFQHMLTNHGSHEKVMVSVTSMPIMNGMGEVIGATAALVEIETETGEGIDDLTGLWRGHWFAAATVPFWGLDAKGQIVDINNAALDVFDLKREQAIGRSWAQVFVADGDFQAALDYLGDAQDESDPHSRTSVRLRLKAGDGEMLPALVTAWMVRTHEGGEHGLTVMSMAADGAATAAPPHERPGLDDDEAQELEDFRQGEKALAALGVGIWQYDPQSDSILEDAGMQALIGRETPGGPTLISDDDQAVADAEFARLMSGESDRMTMDIAVAGKDGATRWITLKGEADNGEDGQRRMFGVAFDSTAWKSARPDETAPVDIDATRAEAVAAALAELQARHDAILADPETAAENESLKARLATLQADLDARVAAEQARHDENPEPDPREHEARIAMLEDDLGQAEAARRDAQARIDEMLSAPPAEPDFSDHEARIEALQTQLEQAEARQNETLARLDDLADAPAPAPDDGTHETRIAATADADAARAERDDWKARYEALAAAPAPDAFAVESELAAARFDVAKWQAAHRDLQARLDAVAAQPVADHGVLETRIDELQAALAHSHDQHAETEARLDQLHASLSHARRFETVGRLTGDVAQDFAQMLAVINNALEVMARQENSPENIRRLSEAALAAGKRGERLTRQLQAFQSEEF